MAEGETYTIVVTAAGVNTPDTGRAEALLAAMDLTDHEDALNGSNFFQPVIIEDNNATCITNTPK